MLNSLKVISRDFFINSLASSVIVPNKLRKIIYKFYGIQLSTVRIQPRVFFGNKNISIGSGSFINYDCFFDTNISIGNNCSIGYRTLFSAGTHEIGDFNKRAGKPIFKSITVKDGVWIGANCTILPGVTIGEGCIVAAGAVVTKNCEPNGVYAGVPAKRIKDLG
ncbi:maltose O-acetyltransferase [Neobacillus niacini]|uniref:acyltransferase n=1 Tax=Neobacillus driksii TaxID=3035913 RepID=UPI00277F3D48|nr:acyltransferase [Neobacillus niacini]MDQ0974628.1 maltose O-acetyltransferase [Neobacillus niacini]